MNCTRIRVVINASITIPSDTNPARIERTPSTTSETLGNPWVGWSRANTLKKYPSFAAAYGTREYPSNRANTEPNAVHRIIAVNSVATPGPYVRSMKMDTTKPDCACEAAGTKSRHGTTPMIDRLTAR